MVSMADSGEYCIEVMGQCNVVTNCGVLLVLTNVMATGPMNETACPESTVTLMTSAVGTGPIDYQWYKDGSILMDQTNSSLVLPGVSVADEGDYCVAVTGPCGAVTNCARVEVLAIGLVVTKDCPADPFGGRAPGGR
jgi:hypothetical protein